MGLTAAFDASGDESSQLVLLVAGFVSSASDWEDFSKLWLDRLKADGLVYMHMKEFSHSRGQFEKGWKGETRRRESLLKDLMNIIRSHAYRKFGLGIVNDTFRASLSTTTMEQWSLNAYSLAGRTCVKDVDEWTFEEHCRSTVEFVFEEGDKGWGLLCTRLLEDGYQKPTKRPKKDRYTPEGFLVPAFVPLQAADFLAYEYFLELTRAVDGSDHNTRWALEEFERMPGRIGTYTLENLKDFEDMVKITKEMDEWAVSTGLLKRNSSGRLYREGKVLICDLHLFAWSDVDAVSGQPGVKPFCKTHPKSNIEVTVSRDAVTAICRYRDNEHPLNTCPVEAFQTEKEQARLAFLKNKGTSGS
jgi:hypothetical protein